MATMKLVIASLPFIRSFIIWSTKGGLEVEGGHCDPIVYGTGEYYFFFFLKLLSSNVIIKQYQFGDRVIYM